MDVNRNRFKKKKDDQAWLDWLSDDIPEPDASFPVDPSRAPLPEESPELEPAPKRQPAPLKPIPVVPETPPERRPIFGNSDEAPAFSVRRPVAEEPPQHAPRVAVKPASVVSQPTPQMPPVQAVVRHAKKPQAIVKAALKTEVKANPAAAPVAVSIQINMPAFHKPQFKRTKAVWVALKPQLTRARILKVSIPIAVIAVLWIGLAINKHIQDNKAAQAAKADSSASAPVATKPSFTPVVPGAKASLGTPDNVHSRYDATKKSYSFLDTLDGKQITVSQQQLPANGTTASDTVAKVAKSLNATTQFKTGYGTVYAFTSQKYGYQSLVFSIRDLLMFANSPSAISNSKWIDYINALD